MPKVLLIEDENDIREVASTSLSVMAGWEVVTAASGLEGLEKAAAERPDAILLDVMMPDLDGPSTLAKLKANPATKDIPVVFMTAKVQASDRERFQGLPIKGLISKPFDPLTLHEEVARLMEWS